MKISAWLTFLNFGPYHLSRLNACEELLEIQFLPVAVARNQSEYSWRTDSDSRIQFLERERFLESVHGSEWSAKLQRLLTSNPPDVVFIAGYSHPAMLTLILLCANASIPWILMSDSREVDAPRRVWQEALKKRIVRLASAGFVAGHPHSEYLQSLGMPARRIVLGYDVVDNRYFKNSAEQVRKNSGSIGGDGFFLASNRFIEKKNLLRLVKAYAIYASRVSGQRAAPTGSEEAGVLRSLVLLGDGPLKAEIEALCETLGVRTIHSAPWDDEVGGSTGGPALFLPGFRQIEELPRFYARAAAFIHASTVDQWGLVVNEAMASGLPVLVSRGCGCAPDLVQEGVNGWTFDPTDEEQIARLMLQVGAMSPSSRAELGIAGQRIIEAWGPERFAEGCKDSAANALAVGAKKVGAIDRLLLAALIRR